MQVRKERFTLYDWTKSPLKSSWKFVLLLNIVLNEKKYAQVYKEYSRK